MAERSVAIRIAVREAEEARRRLRGLGADGQAAFDQVAAGGARASKGVKDFSNAALSASRGGGIMLMRGGLQQLAFQAQDVAVQLGSGTAALTVFTQQAPQILSAFGTGGAVLGVLAAGAGAAALGLRGLLSDTEDTEQSTSALAAAQSNLNDILSATENNADDAAAAITRLSEQQVNLLEQASERSIEELATARRQQFDLVREAFEELESIGVGRAFFERGIAAAESRGLEIPGATDEDLSRFQRILTTFDEIDAARATGEFEGAAEAVARLLREIGNTSSEVQEVGNRLIDAALAADELGKQMAAAERNIRLFDEGAAEGLIFVDKFLDELEKANDKAERVAESEARAAERLVKRRAEALAGLEAQTAGLERVLKAELEGAEAAKLVEAAVAGENAARKVGLDLTTKAGRAIAEEAAEREILKGKIQELRAERQKEEAEAKSAASKAEREAETARRRAEREAEREAEKAAAELERPFVNANNRIEALFTDTFENIFNGGVTSFQDLADEFLKIVTRMAAEATTLLILRPQIAGAGGFGATGASGVFGSIGGQVNQFGARLGFAPQVGPPAPGLPTATLSQTLGAAGLGGAAGFGIGSIIGGGGAGGQIGGAAGGALGAGAGFAFGGPVGGLLGGGLGSVLGGVLGGVFGGGNSDNTGALRFSASGRDPFGGPFGGSSISGENSFAGPLTDLLRTFDNAVVQFLTVRQRRIAASAIQALPPFEGRFPETDPSAGFEAILRERAGVALNSALPGANVGRILGGATGAADIADRTERALQVNQLFRQLTATPEEQIDEQIEAVKREFAAIRPIARELGLDIDLLNSAMADQIQAIRDAADATDDSTESINAQIRALRDQKVQLQDQALGVSDQFDLLIDPLRSLRRELTFELASPIDQFGLAQDQFARTLQRAQNGNLAAIGDLSGAGRLLIDQAGQFGASPAAARATAQVQEGVAAVIEDIRAAQATANTGLESEIRRAADRQVVRLDDLVEEARNTLREIKKLRIEIGNLQTQRAA